MNYQETLDYMYSRMPMFQVVGSAGYKEGLEGICELDAHLGHRHREFRTIHVGGTNGKGSISHTLCSILMSAGLKVGLFTSPHLKDFRERIRVNGECIPQEKVVSFVERNREAIERIMPSFFEVCVGMAFEHFAEEKIDVAVIEVGLGGRLDSTNIIAPDLCVVTNISMDHMNILGDSITAIATEKAGIFKAHTAIVIGETTAETRQIFADKAKSLSAPIVFSEDVYEMTEAKYMSIDGEDYQQMDVVAKSFYRGFDAIQTPLLGIYQRLNMRAACCAARELQRIGYAITDEQIADGICKVVSQTHLMGRWQTLCRTPRVVCDAGHNEAGIQMVCEQLRRSNYRTLHIVFGMAKDKDVDHILPFLPKDATYYFTRAKIARAMDEHVLREKASAFGLSGNAYHTIAEALEAAKADCKEGDMVFVGGSCYVVAEVV